MFELAVAAGAWRVRTFPLSDNAHHREADKSFASGPKWRKGMDYRQLTISPEARIAPNATIIGKVSLAKDVTVFAGASLRGDYGSRIEVGEGSNIQEGVCVHVGATTPTVIGRGCTVGHGAIVHGCTIGDNVLVGMGSIVMDNAQVGDNCIIGAGALVTGGTQIPAGSLVVGSPAKVKRTLTDQEIAANRVDAQEYVEIGKDLVAQGLMHAGDALPNDSMTIAL